jgi:hypothetical protein
MTRLPTSGSSVVAPCREESELKHVLSKLCPARTFDDDAVHEYYVKLASLIGGIEFGGAAIVRVGAVAPAVQRSGSPYGA